jgi:membrane-bound ClpP family serine protease
MKYIFDNPFFNIYLCLIGYFVLIAGWPLFNSAFVSSILFGTISLFLYISVKHLIKPPNKDEKNQRIFK